MFQMLNWGKNCPPSEFNCGAQQMKGNRFLVEIFFADRVKREKNCYNSDKEIEGKKEI